MKILKKIFLALAITSTLGVMTSYSTVAVAVGSEAMRSGKVILAETVDHLDAALKAIEAGEDIDVVKAHVGNARQSAKDLSVGSLASRVTFAADDVVRAKKMLKKGKIDEAKELIKSAKDQYEGMIPDVL